MREQRQIVSIGTTKQKRKWLTLFMILILSQQLIYSQTVVIDQVKETTLLDKQATIDKAKFVENERKLRKDNAQLLEIIRKQDSTIAKITNDNIVALKTIQKQNDRIFELSKDVLRLSDLQLGYEEKKTKQPRLYAFGGLDYYQENELYLPNIGLAYLSGKIGFGANVGLIDKNMYYGGKIFISIF